MGICMHLVHISSHRHTYVYINKNKFKKSRTGKTQTRSEPGDSKNTGEIIPLLRRKLSFSEMPKGLRIPEGLSSLV